MTEKAARALHAVDWDEFGHASPTSTGTVEGDWDALGPKQKQDYRWRGRAVLEAIREPTEAMVLAACRRAKAEQLRPVEIRRADAHELWQAMVEEALKGPA